MRPAATKTRAIGDDSPAAHLENESGGGASQERSPIPAMLQRPRSGRRPAPARSVPAGTSPPAERAQRLHGRRVGGSGCASGSRRSAGAPRVATAAAPSVRIDRARLQGRVRGRTGPLGGCGRRRRETADDRRSRSRYRYRSPMKMHIASDQHSRATQIGSSTLGRLVLLCRARRDGSCGTISEVGW